MKKKNLQKLAVAVPLTIVGVIGVAHAVQDYQGGSVFQPFASDRALQSNQVLFPDDGETTDQQQGDQTDNSALWEKNQDAEETQRPQQQDRADYLFQDNTAQAGLSNALTGNESSNAGNTPGQATVPGSIFDIVGDKNQADTIISGGGTTPGGTPDNGTGTTPGTNPGTGDNGNNGGTVTPTPTPTPTPDPTPTPTPTPTPKPDKDNSGGNSGGTVTPTPTPDQPTKADTAKDPDTPKEEPSDSGWGETNTPIDSNSPRPGSDSSAYLNISMPYPCPLYWGQTVDELTIFRAMKTYLSVIEMPDPDDLWNYTITNYYWGESQFNKLFRIDGVSLDGGETYLREFPITIPEGDMKIQVSYRYDTSENWETKEIDCTPSPSRLYVLSEPLEQENQTIDSSMVLNSSNADMFRDVGEMSNLFYYQMQFYGYTFNQLEKLFPGWTEKGQLVPFFYPVTGGRHVLEPADLVDYDCDTYQVYLKLYLMNTNYAVSYEGREAVYVQALEDYTGNTQRLAVPQYVQAVDFSECTETKNIDRLILPSSTVYVNLGASSGLSVKKGYTVDSANPRYTTKDDCLYTKDMTELVAVPEETTEVEIPGTVTSVTLPENNSLTKLVFQHTDQSALPEVNLEALAEGSKLVVEPGVLSSFLEMNYAIIGEKNLQVSRSDAPDVTYTIQNGMIVRTDTGTVSGLLPSNGNVLYLTDTIGTIDSSALAAQGNVDTIVMPGSGSLPKLPSDLFTTGGIKTVICYTQNQLEAMRQLVPEGVTVKMLSEKNGYTYFITNDGAVLVSAPTGITEFTGTELGVDICAISDQAFTQCQSLVYVTLPESVKRIGTQAFYGCNALEGLLIDSRDSIVIGDKAFDNCPSLRFVASNAPKATLQNSYSPTLFATYDMERAYLFCPPDNDGYTGGWTYFDPQHDQIDYYKMENVDESGSGKVLCGVDGREWGEGEWMVIRAGKTMPAKVTLPQTIRYLYAGSFADTVSVNREGYAVNWEDLKHNQSYSYYNLSVDNYAFAGSDLGGDMVVPGDVAFYDNALASCPKLTSVTFSGSIAQLGKKLFIQDENLTAVTFGTFDAAPAGGRNDLKNRLFEGCSSLTTLTFTSATPPDLAIEGMSDAYTFNSNWEDKKDDSTHVKLIVPEGCEQAYLDAWCYIFAGYTDSVDYYTREVTPAYKNMRDAIKRYPLCTTDEEVDAEVYKELLAAENRLRTLLGMDPIEKRELYNWKISILDLVTLTSVYTDKEAITLNDGSLEGVTLDYIGPKAFTHAPNLKTVTVDANVMYGIYSGAFADAPNNIILKLTGGESGDNNVVGLLPNEEGKPFDFSGLARVVIPEEEQQAYLNIWLYPASGYTDYTDLYMDVADCLYEEGELKEDLEANKILIDETINKTMLKYENQLRRLFGMAETDTLTADLQTTTIPIPDDREWDDLVPDDAMNNGSNTGSGDDDLTETDPPGSDSTEDGAMTPTSPPGTTDPENKPAQTPGTSEEETPPPDNGTTGTETTDPPKQEEPSQPEEPSKPAESTGDQPETEILE